MCTLTLRRPDDWHIHLRDDDYLARTVADAARVFGRVLVMPNLVPPVTDVEAAREYRDRILAHAPTTAGARTFEPVMTLYLTDEASKETVSAASRSDFIAAFKLYPAGATTNSAAGVNAIDRLYPVFEAMQDSDVVLSIHGEVTEHDVDIFDREAVFIDRILSPIVERFPELRIVLEHITTRDAVEFVSDSGPKVAATITAHHLLYNRNDLLVGGVKPIHYCLPVLKRSTHQTALVRAATSGGSSFFLGTDSAPHPRHRKENACGCAAGCYTGHAAFELYAEVFSAEGHLDRLEAFSSEYGADFYGMPRNADTITLSESAWEVPASLTFGGDELIPTRAGQTVHWKVTSGCRAERKTRPVAPKLRQ